jgi:Icc protein
MRLAWLTDIHLNFLAPDAVDAFLHGLSKVYCDGVIVSGDIGEAPDVALYLNALNTWLEKPIYFVLGNHDFYRGSIAGIREAVKLLCAGRPHLRYLPNEGVIELTQKAGLVGADGWGDGRYGDYWGRRVSLNDWLDDTKRLAKLHELGDESAAQLRATLPDALERFDQVLVVTHVPPFRESCWHEGRISDKDWLPHFTCKAVGDVLLSAMKAHPEKQMTILCGHTHGAGEAQILPNLRVLTGGAEYGTPMVQRILEIG